MKQLGAGVVIGAIVALAGSYFTGYLSAMALPQGVPGSTVGRLLWDLGIQFLGFGILSFVLMFCAVKLHMQGWMATAAIALISVQVVLAGLFWPAYSFHALHIAVLAVSLALGGIASARNNRSKIMPQVP